MKTQTHIATQRTEGVNNMFYVLTVLRMNKDEYEWHFIDCGLDFLRKLFPANEIYQEYYEYHMRKKFFWKWFRVQWLSYEQSYVNYLQDHHIIPTESAWREEMLKLASDEKTLIDFDHYIKLLSHGQKK